MNKQKSNLKKHQIMAQITSLEVHSHKERGSGIYMIARNKNTDVGDSYIHWAIQYRGSSHINANKYKLTLSSC